MSLSLSARDLAVCSLGAALLTLCSWLTVPAAVPFTMQSFAVCLLAALLGRRLTLCAFALYLLLGVIGLPVFSGFHNGAAVLLGPTGGYLLGFFLTVLCVGFAADRSNRRPAALAWSMFFGMLLCYACGTLWFVVVYTHSSGEIGVGTALSLCVLPFLLPDGIKCALALLLAKRLRPILDWG